MVSTRASPAHTDVHKLPREEHQGITEPPRKEEKEDLLFDDADTQARVPNPKHLVSPPA